MGENGAASRIPRGLVRRASLLAVLLAVLAAVVWLIFFRR